MSNKLIVRYGPLTRLKSLFGLKTNSKPLSSEVLTTHLKSGNPFWSSYFIRYESVINDQFGYSHFNWTVDAYNYHVLRTGCYPFIKYHCTRRPFDPSLTFDDNLFTFLKLLNFGIPTLMYGSAARFLIKESECVETSKGKVLIYFYDKEVPNSRF